MVRKLLDQKNDVVDLLNEKDKEIKSLRKELNESKINLNDL